MADLYNPVRERMRASYARVYPVDVEFCCSNSFDERFVNSSYVSSSLMSASLPCENLSSSALISAPTLSYRETRSASRLWLIWSMFGSVGWSMTVSSRSCLTNSLR